MQQNVLDKKLEMEQTIFFQRMQNGELTKRDYLHYLKNLERVLSIFESRPNWFGTNQNISRRKNITVDILELESEIIEPIHITNAIEEYQFEIRRLSDDKLYEHLYINYQNLIDYQSLKQSVPNTGRIFDFENINDCQSFLNSLKKDDWGDESIKAFDYLIKMFKELQLVSDWAASRNNG